METTTNNNRKEVEGVSIKRAQEYTQVLSTREWTDRNGVKHEAAGTQRKQPVSIKYVRIEREGKEPVELVRITFKTDKVTISAFPSDLTHLLQPKSKGSDIGVITATELSYDARNQKFSTDEVEVAEDVEAEA